MNKPYVNLSEGDGNAYAIMAACKRAARRAGWTDEQVKAVLDDMKSDNYDHLLQVAETHFDVG